MTSTPLFRSCQELFLLFHSMQGYNRRSTSLVLVLGFGDAESANLILQSRAFQSEPFGGSSVAGDSPRSGSQSVDDHTTFRLAKARHRGAGNAQVASAAQFVGW